MVSEIYDRVDESCLSTRVTPTPLYRHEYPTQCSCSMTCVCRSWLLIDSLQPQWLLSCLLSLTSPLSLCLHGWHNSMVVVMACQCSHPIALCSIEQNPLNRFPWNLPSQVYSPYFKYILCPTDFGEIHWVRLAHPIPWSTLHRLHRLNLRVPTPITCNKWEEDTKVKCSESSLDFNLQSE